jgi:hypothetical protein
MALCWPDLGCLVSVESPILLTRYPFKESSILQNQFTRVDIRHCIFALAPTFQAISPDLHFSFLPGWSLLRCKGPLLAAADAALILQWIAFIDPHRYESALSLKKDALYWLRMRQSTGALLIPLPISPGFKRFAWQAGIKVFVRRDSGPG